MTIGHVVDSDWIVDYLAGAPAARDVLDVLVPRGIGISIISCIEIEEGVLGNRDPESDRLNFNGFLAIAGTLFVDRSIAGRTA